jgi:signal transduction histidine kinase
VRSIRRDLLLFIVVGVLGVVALSGWVVHAIARGHLRSQHAASLLARARTLARLVVNERPDPEDGPNASGGVVLDYKGSLREQELGVLVRITDADGREIACSPEWPRELASSDDSTRPAGMLARLSDGDPALLVMIDAVPHAETDEDEPAEVGPGVQDGGESEDGQTEAEDAHAGSPSPVRIAILGRREGVLQAERAILGSLLIGGCVATGGAAVAIWIGVRRGLRPLDRLRADVDSIDPDSGRIGGGGHNYPVEVRPVVEALDGLLGRVRAAMERERRFTDAAAHELRTPLAEMRTIAEVATRWPEPERLQRGMSEVQGVVGEMQALLEGLLAGAREASEPAATVRVVPAVLEASARARSVMERRGVAWEMREEGEVCWQVPHGGILVILRNLLENAAEYTTPGGIVRVVTIGERSELAVENGPASLGPEEVERLFEPFWRADSARSDRSHRGLGLWIVATLAERIGMEVRADLVGDTLRMTVRPRP